MKKTHWLLIFSLLLASIPLVVAENEIDDKVTIYFFYSTTCPHCAEEKPFLEELERKHPRLEVEYLEAGKNMDFFRKLAQEYETTTAGVPRTFLKDKVFIGFSDEEGELVYHEGYKAYIGYKNQIELCLAECLNVTCPLPEGQIIEISKESPLVKDLLKEHPNSLATTKLVDATHLVAWWTPERISSNLQYPNVLVTLDAFTDEILSSEIPNQEIEGIEKPIQGVPIYYYLIATAIFIYLVLYLLLRNKLTLERRYWLAGFITLLIISGFVMAMMTPSMMIEKFAKKFPFPVFVFIIALFDGVNPCAFTVLVILLSLLTYTRSRKSMLLIGSIFIITSGIMYFIFIMIILLASSLIFSEYGLLLFKIIGVILLIAGIINLKDFFWFKKGVSLSISEKSKQKITKRAGKIVREVKMAQTKKAMLIALASVILLAVFVNLVELGCTAMLPGFYTGALLAKFGSELSFAHYSYTAFYAIVYIIPLFAILSNFIYSFKSERLTEKQGKTLKLIGGIMMLLLGIIMLVKPELLTLG